MASIPHEARRLAASLRHSRYEWGAELEGKTKSQLRTLGFRSGEARTDGHPALLWGKLYALFARLERWEAEPRYSAFAATAQSEFAALKQRFEQLSRKAERYLRVCDDLAQEDLVGRTQEAIAAMLGELGQQANDLLREPKGARLDYSVLAYLDAPPPAHPPRRCAAAHRATRPQP
jgi:hypothetical protein